MTARANPAELIGAGDSPRPAAGFAGRSLEISGINKRFGAFPALRNVTLTVGKGEFVCILGPSGCGKTTLLRVIAGLEKPDSGTVRIEGFDVTDAPVSRRGVGIVFQSYALFPNLDAMRNVAFGIRRPGWSRRDVRRRAGELLSLVGLEECAGKYPAQMSGGQQQRIALARALATEPAMLLLDEPLSALDAKVRADLRREIRSLQRRLGITAVMVTHDQEEALTMADRVVVMVNGGLAQFASPEEIYRLPSTPFVADFIGSMNFLPRWRLESGLARYGSCSLALAGYPESGKVNITLAIRPEDVRIGRDGFGANQLIAHVEAVEFKGSSYRVTLKIPNNRSTRAQRLDAIVPPREYAFLRLRSGECVTVSLPAESLLCFDRAEPDETPPLDGID
ncbi:MAG: ATP-binding cassette domain-containing protein [Planctomycetota bacterium]|jgi:iron(III) transport system ATP-binding protein|nr:ATP-binding cassette domain-containing protein [Planctomycetota bacterium]MDR1520132.1 ATP-binding cassette domain-containing protein [Planctomycetota bacterium]